MRMIINEFKAYFDPLLREYLAQKIQDAKMRIATPVLEGYISYIDNFIASGGKRIRPYGARAMYKGLGGQADADMTRFSMIFELLHSMALIHDDIIDQAEKRHNIPSVNALAGDNQALLIGDLVFAWVYELLMQGYNFAPEALQNARAQVHAMIEEVILGQMIDVELTKGIATDRDLIQKKNIYKTASYTFTRPMLAGACLAQADAKTLEIITQFGNVLGLAFQLKDDLSDITFADETKTPFSDIQEGQQTFFTNYIFTQGSVEQQQLLKSSLGRKLSSTEITQLQDLFHASGAIEAAKSHISAYLTTAHQFLDQIPFTEKSLIETIQLMMKKIEG